jgi:phosphate transport system substrate-binding protein
MKKLFKLFLAALLIFNLSQTAFSKSANKITAEGSTTVLPLAQKAAETLMERDSEIDISVRGGGSGVGINALLQGRCDIALSSRPIKESELQAAAGKKITPKVYVVAMDAIAVIVNNNNKIDGLTREQIKNIFTGKITNWKEIGGGDKKITAVSRDSASGTFETFNELALGGEKVSKNAYMQSSNQGVAALVANTDGAIGYVGLGYITNKVKAVKIDEISPSIKTVLNGEYIYKRALLMYSNGEAKGTAKKYIDFIISDNGQKIVEELGFVPLK